MTYDLAEMRRDSDRAIAGFRRRSGDLPDIDSEALAESLSSLITIWSVMASIAIINLATAAYA